MFTSLLASAVVLVVGVAVIAWLVWGTLDIPLPVWQRANGIVVAGAAVFVAYYGFVYWDWQPKRAA